LDQTAEAASAAKAVVKGSAVGTAIFAVAACKRRKKKGAHRSWRAGCGHFPGIVLPLLTRSRFLGKLRRIYVRIKNQESSQTVLAGDGKRVTLRGIRRPVGRTDFPP
jgi:hypothetical protein